LPRFSLETLYRYPWRSIAKDGTCLKIMVSPVRVRVLPLLKYLQNVRKRLALSARFHVERRFYHNGHSLEVLREKVVEAHSGLTVHSGGNVKVMMSNAFWSTALVSVPFL
jgi:hypothetical protein